MQVVSVGQTKFKATLMDELLEHLKAIADPKCKDSTMSYLQFMQEKYQWQPERLQLFGDKAPVGIQHFDKSFAHDVLNPFKNALINLLHRRPFDAAIAQRQKQDALAKFRSLVQCLHILDDSEWRPVALVAMRKAQEMLEQEPLKRVSHAHFCFNIVTLLFRLCTVHYLMVFFKHRHVESFLTSGTFVQDVLTSLNKFMTQLEHLAVLLALCNTNLTSPNGAMWRKQQYGTVLDLLTHVRVGTSFAKDLEAASLDMWSTIKPITRNRQPCRLDHSSAVGFLDTMGLYVDRPDELLREDAASEMQLKEVSKDTCEGSLQQMDADLQQKNVASEAVYCQPLLNFVLPTAHVADMDAEPSPAQATEGQLILHILPGYVLCCAYTIGFLASTDCLLTLTWHRLEQKLCWFLLRVDELCLGL